MRQRQTTPNKIHEISWHFKLWSVHQWKLVKYECWNLKLSWLTHNIYEDGGINNPFRAGRNTCIISYILMSDALEGEDASFISDVSVFTQLGRPSSSEVCGSEQVIIPFIMASIPGVSSSLPPHSGRFMALSITMNPSICTQLQLCIHRSRTEL